MYFIFLWCLGRLNWYLAADLQLRWVGFVVGRSFYLHQFFVENPRSWLYTVDANTVDGIHEIPVTWKNYGFEKNCGFLSRGFEKLPASTRFSTRENLAQAPSRPEPKMVERAIGRWPSQVRKVLDVHIFFI